MPVSSVHRITGVASYGAGEKRCLRKVNAQDFFADCNVELPAEALTFLPP
jgi:hypothetical protein